MSVANLTKYAMFGDGDMCAVKDRVDNIQRYVKFEEAMEASSNSLQQLKAEITALASEVYQMSLLHPSEQNFSDIVDRMRQLSAI